MSGLQAALGDFTAVSDFDRCLVPLLEAMGWRGAPRQVVEAMPQTAGALDLIGLRNLFANLDFRSEGVDARLRDVEPHRMPCLFVPAKGPAMVVREGRADGIEVFDGGTGEWRVVTGPGPRGRAFFFTPAQPASDDDGWLSAIVGRFRPLLLQSAFVTFALSMVALAPPLFVMMVYDRVIGSRSVSMLTAMLGAVLLVLFAELLLRSLRGRMLAHTAVRLNMLVGRAAFAHFLALPPAVGGRLAVGSQFGRLLHSRLSGVTVLRLIELPFALLFLGVIAALGGELALVPVVAALLYLGAAALASPALREGAATAARLESERTALTVETITEMRALRTAHATYAWSERYRALSRDAATAGYRLSVLTGTVGAVGTAIATAAALAILALGSERVLGGAMTIGALLAVLMLVFRVLEPLHAAFLALRRADQARVDLREIDAFMRLPAEAAGAVASLRYGRLSVEGVGARRSDGGDAVLSAVSFGVQPGELVAITGPAGAGKSTLLRLVLGLQQPSAGAIRLDGTDLSGFDPVALRQAVAYLPPESHLFAGTVGQNLRLAEPAADAAALAAAARKAGILSLIEALPDGFDTVIDARRPAGLPAALRQGLPLARALLREAPLYLFDDAADALTGASAAAFDASLAALKGRASVLLVTARESRLRLADRVIVLEDGRVRFDGPPDQIIPRLPEGLP